MVYHVHIAIFVIKCCTVPTRITFLFIDFSNDVVLLTLDCTQGYFNACYLNEEIDQVLSAVLGRLEYNYVTSLRTDRLGQSNDFCCSLH